MRLLLAAVALSHAAAAALLPEPYALAAIHLDPSAAAPAHAFPLRVVVWMTTFNRV